MATILRGALLVNRRDIAPPLGVFATLVPNLLVTTLAVVSLGPFKNAEAFPHQQAHPAHLQAAAVDTTQDTPLTLLTSVAPPIRNHSFTAPQNQPGAVKLINPDASHGTNRELFTADATPAFIVAPFFAPSTLPGKGWINASTTFGSPKVSFADATPPPVNALLSTFVPQLKGEKGIVTTDTSQCSPATLLTAPVPAPFVVQPQAYAPHRPDSQRQNPDTSKGTGKNLYAGDQAPLVNAPGFAPVTKGDNGRQLPDTSQSTAKALYGDASTPCFNPAHLVESLRADRLRPNADTSHGLNVSLAIGPQPPPVIVQPNFTIADRADSRRQVVDTSQSTAKALYGDQIAPFVPPAFYGPVVHPGRDWLNSSTAQGSTIFQPIPAPFIPAPILGQLEKVDRYRQLVSTSWGSTIVQAPQAPFAIEPPRTITTKPDAQRINADTSHGTAKALFGDAAAPTFVNPIPTPALLYPADRGRINADTTKGSWAKLVPQPNPVFNPQDPATPQRRDKSQWLADTSQASPTVLIGIYSPLQVAVSMTFTMSERAVTFSLSQRSVGFTFYQ